MCVEQTGCPLGFVLLFAHRMVWGACERLEKVTLPCYETLSFVEGNFVDDIMHGVPVHEVFSTKGAKQ